MNKNTLCLWYDKDAEAAARFYAMMKMGKIDVAKIEAAVRGG